VNKNDILSEICSDKKYSEYCKKIGGDLSDDLFQYVCLYLLEMNEEKLIQLHKTNGLRMYITRIIYISINSNRSDFKKQLFGRLKYEDVEHIEDIQIESNDDLINQIKKEIEKEICKSIKNNSYPATAKLFDIYLEMGSYKAVSNVTGIPYLTVRNHIKLFQKKIKSKIKW